MNFTISLYLIDFSTSLNSIAGPADFTVIGLKPYTCILLFQKTFWIIIYHFLLLQIHFFR